MARPQQDIVRDLLEWRNPTTGMDLRDHIEAELGKLKAKIERTPSFAVHYAERSGELPSTMLAKMEDCLELLDRLKAAPKMAETLSDRDKGVVSDMMEFILVPFRRFGASAAESLGHWGALAAALTEQPKEKAMALNHRTEQMTEEHRRLGELALELCDSMNYSIPPSVRMACRRAVPTLEKGT